MKLRTTLLLILFLALLQGSAWSSDTQPIPNAQRLLTNIKSFNIPHTAGTVTLDGRIEEPLWQAAHQVSLNYEVMPGENTQPEVSTRVWLIENGEYLYVAFRADEASAKQIRAFYSNRDDINNDDFVSVVVDTFNDDTRAYQFKVNALGVQGDASIYLERENDSWNGIWDSATQITDHGYMVEMAIPLNILNFANAEQQTWGINLLRVRPRDTRQVIQLAPMDRDNVCGLCQLTEVSGFRGAKPSKKLLLIPSLTTNYTQNRSPSSENNQSADWQTLDSSQDLGLDVEWGINANSSLNATINPDFSQIEADSMQLTVNNQYALRYQEKRNFFLEGADYFDSPTRAIYTRSIADPDYGVKYTSKTAAHSLGLITGHDSVTNVIQPNRYYTGTSLSQLTTTNTAGQSSPLENDFFIARYSYDLGNASNLGLLLTHRAGGDYRNTVSGVDSQYRLTDKDSVSAQFLNSTTQYQQDHQSLQDQAYYLRYSHDQRNWYMSGSYFATGKDFRADLGFYNRFNTNKLVLGGGYIWYGGNNDFFNRIRVSGDWDTTHDDDGLQLEEEAEIYLTLEGPLQSTVRVGGGQRDNLYSAEAQAINGDIYRLDTLYNESFYSIDANFTPLSGLLLAMFFDVSDQVDYANNQLGDAIQFGLSMAYNVNQHLAFDIEYTNSRLDVKDGELFNASIIDLRANYMFDAKTSLRLNLQLSDVQRDPSLYRTMDVSDESIDQALQLLFAYQLNAKSVLFLGYADAGFSTDGNKVNKTDRSVFLKMSYAF